MEVRDTPQSLEELPLELATLWRRHNKALLTVGLLALAITPPLWYAVHSASAAADRRVLERSPRVQDGSPGGRLGRAADAAQTGFGLVVLLMLAIGAPVAGLSMAAAAGARLLGMGAPKAGRTPRKTLQRFYNSALGDGEVDSLRAIVCLTGHARLDFESAEGPLATCRQLRCHWDAATLQIWKAAKANTKAGVLRDNIPLGKVVAYVDRSLLTYIGDAKADYEALLHCHVSVWINGESRATGMHYYAVAGQVVRVGAKWYLTDGKWSGVVEENPGDARWRHAKRHWRP